MTTPGDTLTQRGWKIVSVDYHAGAAGLQDVLDAVGAELVQPTGGLLCIYGESAGAQLALVAAARVPGVDCVVAMGPPADFETYQNEVRASNDPNRTIIANQMALGLGLDAGGARAERPGQARRRDRRRRPDHARGRRPADPDRAGRELRRRPPDDPARRARGRARLGSHQFFVHGTLSETAAASTARRSARSSIAPPRPTTPSARRRRSGCKGTTRSVKSGGVARVQRALTCLAQCRPARAQGGRPSARGRRAARFAARSTPRAPGSALRANIDRPPRARGARRRPREDERAQRLPEQRHAARPSLSRRRVSAARGTARPVRAARAAVAARREREPVQARPAAEVRGRIATAVVAGAARARPCRRTTA